MLLNLFSPFDKGKNEELTLLQLDKIVDLFFYITDIFFSLILIISLPALLQSSIMHHTRGVSTLVGRYPSCMVDTPHVWGVSKIRIPPMYGGYPPFKGGIYHTW